jgi:hypothetical protein
VNRIEQFAKALLGQIQLLADYRVGRFLEHLRLASRDGMPCLADSTTK